MIEEVVDLVIKRGLELGASEVEAYCRVGKVTDVNFDEKVRFARSSYLSGLAIRLVYNNRVGFYSTHSLDKNEVLGAVEHTFKIAKVAPEDPRWRSLPKETSSTSVIGTYDKKTAELDEATIIDNAISIIQYAREVSDKVSVADGHFSTSVAEVAIKNSYGDLLKRRATRVGYYVSIKAEDAGKLATYATYDSARCIDRLIVEDRVKAGARRALDFLSTAKVEVGKYPIVIHGEVFSDILSVMFGRTLSADLIQEGRSPYIGKLNSEIADVRFTLIDDGTLEFGVDSKEFDDEGVRTRRNVLIEGGILRTYLYDTYRAGIENRESTGSAVKTALSSLPLPMPHNLILRPGDYEFDELLKEVRRGIYVERVIGEWLSNPISGLLNATVTHGYLIENGELGSPVSGFIISGSFFELIRSSIVGLEKVLHRSGSVYSPSTAVSKLSVSSK